MNIVLVPALLLLLGVVFYKKVWEPKHSGAGERAERVESKPKKSGKAKKPGKKAAQPAAAMVEAKPGKRADKKAVKARAAVSTGRMGSVL